MSDDQLSDVLNVDISDLSIAEIVEIEDRTGLPLDAMGQDDKPKGRMLQALAFIVKRRDNPDFTWEMAGALKISTASDPVDPSDGDE